MKHKYKHQDCFEKIQVGDIIVWDGVQCKVHQVFISAAYGIMAETHSEIFGNFRMNRYHVPEMTKIIKAPR